MEKFSVIIPTMWKTEILKCSISEYVKSELIDEIIIIDNDPSSKFDVGNSKKIRHISEGENIFVNPSWNWGVKESKNENLIFANDDVCIENLDLILEKFNETDLDIIGLDGDKVNSSTNIVLDKPKGNMPKGFGYFFHLKKKNYIKIPEDLKIFYGDIILYNSLKNRFTFYCDKITMQKSVTSHLFNDHFINFDKPIFKQKYEKIYQLK
jgi:hypothetical protein